MASQSDVFSVTVTVRIASLVEYFSDYADYSVVALLPEDEAALADGHERVSNI